MCVKVTIHCITLGHALQPLAHLGLSSTCPKRQGTHGRPPQLKTPPEYNPGSPGLEGRGQVCLVGSCFTLLHEVKNCTALLVEVAGKRVLKTFNSP